MYDALVASGNKSDAANVVKDESRRVATLLMRRSGPKTRQQGEKKLRRNLDRLFSEAHDNVMMEAGSRFGLGPVSGFYWRKRGGGNLIELKWGRIDPTGARMGEYHSAFRNGTQFGQKRWSSANGLLVWNAGVAVPFGAVNDYFNKIKRHVGLWAASWGATALAFGGKVPAWIRERIPGNKATVLDTSRSADPTQPAVTFGSRSRGCTGQAELVDRILRMRAKAMSRRMQVIASGYSEDFARKSRPKPGAGAKQSGAFDSDDD